MARQATDTEEMRWWRRSEIDQGFLLPTLLASTLALPRHQSSLAQTLKPTEDASSWLSDFRVVLGELESFHLSQATGCLPDGGQRPRTGVIERKGETGSSGFSRVQSCW